MHMASQEEVAARIKSAETLAQKGRFAAAGRIYDALLKQHGDDPGLRARRGEMAYAAGEWQQAVQWLDPVLQKDGENVQLLKVRGSARAYSGDIQGAADDASLAVTLAPKDAEAVHLLGRVLLALDRNDEAIVCLGEAARLEPTSSAYIFSLADGFAVTGQLEPAEEILSALIQAAPAASFEPYLALAQIYLRAQRAEEAAEVLLRAKGQGFIDAKLDRLLGDAYMRCRKFAEAAVAYQAVLRLDQQAHHARRLYALAKGAEEGAAVRDQLASSYDSMAAEYDAWMVQSHYRVPGLIRQAVERFLSLIPPSPDGGSIGPILDLGCGTGLVGVVLGDLVGEVVKGVDISQRMMEWARAKQVYSHLIRSDLIDAMGSDDQKYALITAAECLCFRGDLSKFLESAYDSLLPNGFLIFSAQLLEDESGGEPYVLDPSGYYKHRETYLRSVLTDSRLHIEEMATHDLRDEGGTLVRGVMIVARRPEHPDA